MHVIRGQWIPPSSNFSSCLVFVAWFRTHLSSVILFCIRAHHAGGALCVLLVSKLCVAAHYRGFLVLQICSQFLVPPLRIFLQKPQKQVGMSMTMMKRRIFNHFWTQLGLCVEDPVYATEPRVLNEFCDAMEFVAYGEEQCKLLGIEDDAEKVDFLFQALVGKAWSWYAMLPTHVRSSWLEFEERCL